MNKKQKKIQEFIKVLDDLIQEHGPDSTFTVTELREIFEDVYIRLNNEQPEQQSPCDEPFFVSKEYVEQMKQKLPYERFIEWLNVHYVIDDSPGLPILKDEDLKEIDGWMKELN